MSWIGYVEYKLELTGKIRGVHYIIQVSFLHSYLPGGTQWGPPDPIVAGEDQEYEIERIETHK